ncbi:hypothetical protein M153_14540002798, partial [Pseudoloma neurophilia]
SIYSWNYLSTIFLLSNYQYFLSKQKFSQKNKKIFPRFDHIVGQNLAHRLLINYVIEDVHLKDHISKR